MKEIDDLEIDLIKILREKENWINGDKVVIARGDWNIFKRSHSNSVRVEIIKDKPKVIGGDDVVIEAEVIKSDGRRATLALDNSICATCQSCITICPHHIFITGNKQQRQTKINFENVNFCELDNQCVETCPTGALEIIQKES